MRNAPPRTPVSQSDASRDAGAGQPGTLFQRLRPELLRFAYWLSRDRSVAEDVVQEALLRAWRSRDALKDHSAARGWLMTIVRREHARLYERKRLETTSVHAWVTEERAELACDAVDGELSELHQAILTLPDEYRIPLVMQVMGGFTTAEIAGELELTHGAVLTRLFRARNKLRAIYGLAPAADLAEGDA